MKNKIAALMMMGFIMALMPVASFAMDYQHKIEVENMTFSWSLDGDKIMIEMSAKTEGWVAVGFDPENAMGGANIIIGAVKGDKFKVEDDFADRSRGHSSDTKLGGTDDVMDANGVEKDGVTTISFTYPLKTDDKYDKPIVTDKPMKIMFAYGAGRDSFKTRHPWRTVYEVNLATGENKKIK